MNMRWADYPHIELKVKEIPLLLNGYETDASFTATVTFYLADDGDFDIGEMYVGTTKQSGKQLVLKNQHLEEPRSSYAVTLEHHMAESVRVYTNKRNVADWIIEHLNETAAEWGNQLVAAE